MSNNDALREALVEAKAVIELYAPNHAILDSIDSALAASKAEPQAQAAEPEVIAYAMFTNGKIQSKNHVEPYDDNLKCICESNKHFHPHVKYILEPLITLQSHREAMAEKEREAQLIASACDKIRANAREEIHGYRETLSKQSAALKACVEALKYARQNTSWAHVAIKLDAAITQAEEVLK